MNYKLKNKNCIITGASQGLGKAMAILLAQEGCNLILVSRRPKPLKIVEKKLNAKIKKKIAFALPYDVTKKDAPKKIINFCKKNFGTPDILINSAGGSRPTMGRGYDVKFYSFKKTNNRNYTFDAKKKMGKSNKYNRFCRT